MWGKVCLSYESIKHPPGEADVHSLLQSFFCFSSSLIEEALAGFLPATGRTPLVSVLDAVNFTTLLCFTTNPPSRGAVLLQPLLSYAD